MKNIKLFTLLAAAALVTVSCSKEEKLDTSREIDGLGGEVLPQTEIDDWLYDNYTEPYNIEVSYRWTASDIQASWKRPLVPVHEDQVIPFMKIIQKIWFRPYDKMAGDVFLKKMTPKRVVLGGSAEYEFGAIKLGEAEGGRKILLLNVNQFDPSLDIPDPYARDARGLRTFLKTIEHEFGHILHQTVMFDKNFQAISAADYDPTNWNNVEAADANALGFISPYAMSGKDEDFVEMLSMIMVYGPTWYEGLLAGLKKDGKTEAVDALRKKEAILVKYMKDVWNIKFYDDTMGKGIVSHVQETIREVLNGNYE